MKKRLSKENLTLRLSIDNSDKINPTILKSWELLNANKLILGRIQKYKRAGQITFRIHSIALPGSYQSLNESHKCENYLKDYHELKEAKEFLIEALNHELDLILTNKIWKQKEI